MTQVETAPAMTVREAAVALGLRSQSIYNLLRDDLLKGEKTPGGIWMLSRESMVGYATRQRLRRVAMHRPFTSGVIEIVATEVHTGA